MHRTNAHGEHTRQHTGNAFRQQIATMINAVSHILPCRGDSQEWSDSDNRANVVGDPMLIFQVAAEGALDLCFWRTQPGVTVWAPSGKIVRQDRVGALDRKSVV